MAQIQHFHDVKLVKVSLVIRVEVVALADFVHNIVLSPQALIHR